MHSIRTVEQLPQSSCAHISISFYECLMCGISLSVEQRINFSISWISILFSIDIIFQGRIQGGGGGGAPAPLKLAKIWFFWRKIVIFHMKYPKNFAPPSARRNFFKCAPPPLTWNPGSAPVFYFCFVSKYCLHPP